ncbi:hypothetical protein AB0I00_24085 [Streptomyces sp. NPDC050803]|uniref:ATP-grasp domain-containing protein n=1 Tax=unclassified Streptomyces TaxID=2593676 RepID=UPI003447D9EB
MRRLAVVHDVGAASVVDVAVALEGVAEPVFVCPDSRMGDQPREEMAELGCLCDIGGLSADEAAAKVRQERPDGIVTFNDYQLATTATLAAALELPFHRPDLVRTLLHKSAQRAVLNACGASDVASRPVTDEASALRASAEVGLPAVLKPDVGTGSRSTYRIRSTEDLLSACRTELPGEAFVLERELPGRTDTAPWADFVSVETAVLDGRLAHLAVTGKFPLEPPFRETGSFVPAGLGEEDERRVVDVVTRALTALDVRTGICHTEVKLTPTGPQVIEVNGRLGGAIGPLLARSCGLDPVRLAARIALGDTAALDETKDVTFDRIAFKYARQPPESARRVAQVHGLERLRTLPGVQRVVPGHGAGAATDWQTGTAGHVYQCFGSTASHGELAVLLEEMSDAVEVRYA